MLVFTSSRHMVVLVVYGPVLPRSKSALRVLVVLDPRELGLAPITLIPCMLPLARQAVGLQGHRVSGVCGASVA